MILENFMLQLTNWGVADVLLPFILVFTIVFAVMQKTKILGDGRKQFNVVIALVMAMSVVIPHVTGSWQNFGFDPVDAINNSLPSVSLIIVAILMALIVLGVFGNDIDIAGTSLSGIAVLVSFIAVGLIFGSQAGLFHIPDWLYFLSDPEIQSFVVMILIFAIVIWFITKEDKKDKVSHGGGEFFKDIGRSMQKKK
jgi:hypothetical protein